MLNINLPTKCQTLCYLQFVLWSTEKTSKSCCDLDHGRTVPNVKLV